MTERVAAYGIYYARNRQNENSYMLSTKISGYKATKIVDTNVIFI